MTSRNKTRSKPVPESALLGLQKVDLFRGLDSYALREIAAQCKWLRVRRNEYVMRRDGADRDVYFVIAGTMRVAASAGRGRRIIFRDVSAGEVFGEHSALDGGARFADAQALRESLLASISPEAFRALLANHASVAERLLRRLSGSLRELADRLLELGAQPVQRRIWLELARLAREAGVAQNRARLEPAPTHSDVASRVGTSREQVSREFSRLAREGVLERAAKALLVRDVAALESFAGEMRGDAQEALALSKESVLRPELISTKAHDPGRRNFRVGGDDGAR